MKTKCIPVPITSALNDLGWLSLVCDADGLSTHANELTFLGITPEDLGTHDPDGTDLAWISLERG
jgi:hypothetical protein